MTALKLRITQRYKQPIWACTAVTNDRVTVTSDEQALAKALEASLLAEHGPLMFGPALSRALGHTSGAALRQAKHRGQAEVPLFTMPNRRPLFALTSDVARCLAHMRFTRALT
jgi:hypothetical protein